MRTRVTFLRRDAGGRNNPPQSLRYSTVARFRTGDQWSVVLDFDRVPTWEPCDCEVRLLIPDGPDWLLLSPFELLEGSRRVATVVPLPIAKTDTPVMRSEPSSLQHALWVDRQLPIQEWHAPT